MLWLRLSINQHQSRKAIETPHRYPLPAYHPLVSTNIKAERQLRLLEADVCTAERVEVSTNIKAERQLRRRWRQPRQRAVRRVSTNIKAERQLRQAELTVKTKVLQIVSTNIKAERQLRRPSLLSFLHTLLAYQPTSKPKGN